MAPSFSERKSDRSHEWPLRLEITPTISGVSFDECYTARVQETFEGVSVNFISLRHLKINKQASGRYKDLNDLKHLP